MNKHFNQYTVLQQYLKRLRHGIVYRRVLLSYNQTENVSYYGGENLIIKIFYYNQWFKQMFITCNEIRAIKIKILACSYQVWEWAWDLTKQFNIMNITTSYIHVIIVLASCILVYKRYSSLFIILNNFCHVIMNKLLL